MVALSAVNLVFEMFALTFCGIVAATATVLFLLLLERAMHFPRGKPPVEPILVQESPMPTRSSCTPTDSPPIVRTKAKRAGARRVPMHRRLVTEVFNPRIQGECGFEAVLWIAGVTPTKRRIAELRQKVAKEIYKARVEGLTIAGLSVHDILVQEGLSLESYMEKVRKGLWASVWEVHAAAKIMGVKTMYEDPHVRCEVGDKEGIAKYAVRLKKGHYVVVKVHKRRVEKGKPSCQRGGMKSSWTDWQEEVRDDTGGTYDVPMVDLLDIESHRDSPREVLASRARSSGHIEGPEAYITEENDMKETKFVYHVNVKQALVEIKYVMFEVYFELTVGELKSKVEDIIHVKDANMDVVDEDESDEELPDWVQAPSRACIKMTGQFIPTVRVNVLVPAKGISFQLEFPPYTTEGDLRTRIATVIGEQCDNLRIADDRGNQWVQELLTPGIWIHVDMLVMRGGMRTQDLTPTEPFLGDQEDQQPHGQQDGEEPGPVVRGRSRDSSRSRSPTTSLYRVSASPTRHAWHSEATPEPISLAQHDPTPRVVLDRHFPVGYVWADPRASLREVRRTMRMDLHMGVDISMEPQEARMWAEVERVRIGQPYPIDLFLFVDLRLTRWELYAEPRGIPVMYKGEIEKYIVVPWNLIMQVAQRRVDLWAERIYTYQIVALDEDNWVILKRLQPDRVRQALTAYEEVVRHHIERGGMRRQAEVVDDHHHVGAWDRNMYLIVWVDFAHSHTYCFAPYVVHRRVSVWRFRRYMAELYGVHEVQVVLSSYNAVLPLEMRMEQIIGTPLIVHIEGRDTLLHSHDRYPTCDLSDGMEGIDPLDTRSQPPSPSLIVPNLIEEAHILHEAEEPPMDYHVPRGAGRRNRLNRADPRTMMLSWAKDKVLEKMPELNPATVHFLLRAENRTVGAILNAKSSIQVKEVIYAAWKRAGLDENGRPPTHESADHRLAQPGGQPIPQPSSEVSQLLHVVQAQSMEVRQLLAVIQSQPTQQDYIALVATLQQQGDAQTQAMKALTDLIGKMESRVEHWENVFLHKLLGNSPNVAPPTPLYADEEVGRHATPSEQEETRGTQQPAGETAETHAPEASASSSAQPPTETPPQQDVISLDMPMLSSLQERSLNTQCAKVVRRAMKPFAKP